MREIIFGKRDLAKLLEIHGLPKIELERELKTYVDTEATITTNEILAEGGGSGGITIISDGGSLTGTYNGSVIVLGEGLGYASMTGDVWVNGDLYCAGLMNYGGFRLEVQGDFLVSDDIQFTPSSTSMTQGDFIIHGNFSFGNGTFNVNPGQSPTFIIMGDMTSNDEDDFYGYGLDGANGLTIYVYGDLKLDYLNLHGGDATDTLAAGQGGNLIVFGNATLSGGLDVYGGNSNYNGMNAGNAGEIVVVGNLIGYVDGRGGNAYADSSAGSAAYIWVEGRYTNYWLNASGGDCSSTNTTDTAGSASYIYCGGITGDGHVLLNGGNRSGTLSSLVTNLVSSPNGGHIESHDSIQVAHLEMRGGDVTATDTNGLSNSQGGWGGTIYCTGDMLAWKLLMQGGNTSGQQAGGGGQITTKGKLVAENLIDLTGGNSQGSYAGPAGLITAKAGLQAHDINLVDGTGGAPATGECGLFLGGNANIGTLNQADRANSYIRAWSSRPCRVTLSVSEMPTKQTLTQPNGSDTSNINSSLGNSIFIYDLNNGWSTISSDKGAVVYDRMGVVSDSTIYCGTIGINGLTGQLVTLPSAYSNSNYKVQLTYNSIGFDSNNAGFIYAVIDSPSTFTIYSSNVSDGNNVNWLTTGSFNA
jgi:hypothetical protein